MFRLWKVFLQSTFAAPKRKPFRRRQKRSLAPSFSPLEPRKLLAGAEIVVNAVHDSPELDFTDSLVTIREAVHLANESDDARITFAPEVNGHTIAVDTELVVEGNVQIDSFFDITTVSYTHLTLPTKA